MIEQKSNGNVIYIRGLNSRGMDHLHLGPITLGAMAGPWSQALTEQGFQVHALDGLGAGTIETQIARAKDLLLASEIGRSNAPFHLIGHSCGGLIARALPHVLGAQGPRILSVTTLATPHLGSALARAAKDLPEKRPLLHHALRLARYNVKEKNAAFQGLLPEALELFNSRYPNKNYVSYRSVIFALAPEQLSWPVKLVRAIGEAELTRVRDDGLVDAESQKWGSVLGEFPLDHLEQLGYSVRLSKARKQEQQKLFFEVTRLVGASLLQLDGGNRV